MSQGTPRSRRTRVRFAALLIVLFAILSCHAPSLAIGPASRTQRPAAEEALFAADLEGSTPRPRDSRLEQQDAPATHSTQPGWIRKIAEKWDAFRRTPLISRVEKVGSWVGGIGRLIRSVPSAIFQGDSRPLIEAIGELLSGATQGGPNQDAPRGRPTERIPSGELSPSGFENDNPTRAQPTNH